MPFAPGHKKIGGKQKGYKSQHTQVRDKIEEILGQDIIEFYIKDLLDHSKNSQELRDGLMAIMPYAVPKLQATEVKMDASIEMNDTDKVKEMALEISGLKDELKEYLKEES